MRTVVSDITNAIAAQSRRLSARAVFYNMRTYFSALTSDNPPSWALDPADGIPEYPIPQDVKVHNTTKIGIIANDGVLVAMRSSSSVVLNINMGGTSLYSYSKPAVQGNYIYYIGNAKDLRRATVDWDLLAGATENCITADTQLVAGPFGHGAVHSPHADLLVLVYPSNGGIAIQMRKWNGANWTTYVYPYPYQIHFPELSIGSEDYFYAVFSAAVNMGGTTSNTFVYITDPKTGRVIGVEFTPSTTDTWSSPFIAVEADLSTFKLCNGLYLNGQILLVGQFARNGTDITSDPVSMILRSTSGRSFTMDQFTLLSRLAHRFMVVTDSNTLHAYDTNRLGTVSVMGYALNGTNAASTTINPSGIRNVQISSGPGSGEAVLNLRAGAEEYYNSAYVATFNLVILYIGYMGPSDAFVDTEYDRYIVTAVEKPMSDGKRGHQVNLVQEGMWRMATQTMPYYLEISGKNGIYDEMQDLTNSYPASGVSLIEDRFSVDFWNAEPYDVRGGTGINILSNGGPGPYTATGVHTGLSFSSADLMEALGLLSYPVYRSGVVTLSVYGWSRTVDSADPTDTVFAWLLVERAGQERLLNTTCNSTYQKWPKTYNGTSAGSYPITFTITSPDILKDDKIKRVVLAFTADSVGHDGTVFCPERVDVTNSVSNGLFVPILGTNKLWTLYPEKAPTRLKAPGYGKHIMFSQKPFKSFDFKATAIFQVEVGDTPTPTNSIVAFGIVGLAKDSNNCIIARYNLRHSPNPCWELVKVRDGKETILTTNDETFSLARVMFTFEKIGGTFYIRRFNINTNTWNASPSLTYVWLENDEEISTAPEEELHLGFYAEKSPPSFKIAGFDPNKSDRLAYMPGENTANFSSFGSTGTLVIDDVKYTYSSKTASAIAMVGPYQGLATSSRGAYTNGDSYPEGVYIDVAWFSYLDNTVYSTYYQNYIFYEDTGGVWSMNKSDWRPSDDGVPYYDRSRHTGTNFMQYSAGNSTRCGVGIGFNDVLTAGTIRTGDEEAQEGLTHAYGARAYMYASEEIYCDFFTAFNAEAPLTVRDMISHVAEIAGAKAMFSGDYSSTSFTLTVNTQEYTFYPP